MGERPGNFEFRFQIHSSDFVIFSHTEHFFSSINFEIKFMRRAQKKKKRNFKTENNFIMPRFIQKLYMPNVNKPMTHIIISFWFLTSVLNNMYC